MGGESCYFRIIKFEIVKAVNVKVTILSEVTPCRLVERRTAGFDSVLVRCLTLNIPRGVLGGPQRVIFCDPAVTISTNLLLTFVCIPHQLKIIIM